MFESHSGLSSMSRSNNGGRCEPQVVAQPSVVDICHARSCMNRDLSSSITVDIGSCTKVVPDLRRSDVLETGNTKCPPPSPSNCWWRLSWLSMWDEIVACLTRLLLGLPCRASPTPGVSSMLRKTRRETCCRLRPNPRRLSLSKTKQKKMCRAPLCGEVTGKNLTTYEHNTTKSERKGPGTGKLKHDISTFRQPQQLVCGTSRALGRFYLVSGSDTLLPCLPSPSCFRQARFPDDRYTPPFPFPRMPPVTDLWRFLFSFAWSSKEILNFYETKWRKTSKNTEGQKANARGENNGKVKRAVVASLYGQYLLEYSETIDNRHIGHRQIVCVLCVLHMKPFFPLIDIQPTQCPRWSFTLERYKLCGHKTTTQTSSYAVLGRQQYYNAMSMCWVMMGTTYIHNAAKLPRYTERDKIQRQRNTKNWNTSVQVYQKSTKQTKRKKRKYIV